MRFVSLLAVACLACGGGIIIGGTNDAGRVDAHDDAPATGAAGEPCNPDGTCNAGLTCQEDVQSSRPYPNNFQSTCSP